MSVYTNMCLNLIYIYLDAHTYTSISTSYDINLHVCVFVYQTERV
jgi:hypothetical protein